MSFEITPFLIKVSGKIQVSLLFSCLRKCIFAAFITIATTGVLGLASYIVIVERALSSKAQPVERGYSEFGVRTDNSFFLLVIVLINIPPELITILVAIFITIRI